MPRGGLIIAGAFLRRPVEVVVARIAALLRGFDIGVGERMAVAQIRHRRAARRRHASRPRRARCPPPCGNTAARRQSSSRHCRAAASG